jgi:hypothetical protein
LLTGFSATWSVFVESVNGSKELIFAEAERTTKDAIVKIVFFTS